MKQSFNIDEVFEMAEQIERNGAKFYRKAAERSDFTSSKGLLLKLAEMEDEHERVFGKLRSRFSQNQWQAYAAAPDDEVTLFLRAIADGHIFNVKANPVEAMTGRENLEEVLRTAIKLEEDSIIFYLGLKDAAPEDQGRDVIDKIIKEERGHIVILSRELARI